MGRTFGLTNVASVPDLLLSKPWPRQPGFCPYSISQEVGSLSEKSRPDRRQDAGVLSRLCGWALVRTDRRRREQDSNHQSRRATSLAPDLFRQRVAALGSRVGLEAGYQAFGLMAILLRGFSAGW